MSVSDCCLHTDALRVTFLISGCGCLSNKQYSTHIIIFLYLESIDPILYLIWLYSLSVLHYLLHILLYYKRLTYCIYFVILLKWFLLFTAYLYFVLILIKCGHFST